MTCLACLISLAGRIGPLNSARAGSLADPDGLTLSLGGSCPGVIRLSWEGATPERNMAVIFARSIDNFTMNSPCDGTVLGLGTNGLQLIRAVRAGPGGRGSVARSAEPNFCDGHDQLMVVEGHPCPTSNVAQVP